MIENKRFYDQSIALIERSQVGLAVPLLIGKLFAGQLDAGKWPHMRSAIRAHPLHGILSEDPFVRHCLEKPRGYAGDAPLIDLIYDRQVPANTSELGRSLFVTTTSFQACEGVRRRRDYAEERVTGAHAAGKRICVLACGHFREGDRLPDQDAGNITVVDQDALSLEVVRARHGKTIRIVENNAILFLRSAAARHEKFDLIYTLGLTDYLDDRAMRLLYKCAAACLDPPGQFLVANFMPSHLAVGWMDAVMDWRLICRSENELAGFCREAKMNARTWEDETGCIAWCEASFGS